MPSITDWLMVGITAVYVVATIMICWANINSAKATREQIAESRRQFEEAQRIGVMPEFQAGVEEAPTIATPNIALLISSPKEDLGFTYTTSYTFTLSNIGSGSAKKIAYSWKNADGKYNRGSFTQRFIFPKDSCETVIDFCIAPEDVTRMEPKQICTIYFTYEDILNNVYEQKVELSFHIYSDDSYHEEALRIEKCVTYPAILKKNNTPEETTDV